MLRRGAVGSQSREQLVRDLYEPESAQLCAESQRRGLGAGTRSRYGGVDLTDPTGEVWKADR